MQPTLEQPKTGIGSTAETNRLLGGSYFDEQTGGQIKQFTPTAPSTTFNAEALAQGTKSITIPPTPYSTTAAGITGGSQAVIDNQKINEKLIADEAAKTAKLTEQKVVLDKSKEAIKGKQTEKIAAEGDVNTPGTPAWQKEQARQLSLRLDKSQRGQINELTALETQSMSPAGKQQAESAINRRYALEQGDLQLKYHIAASDYNAAAETLNKKFELELEPLKTDYDDQVNLYNQYKDDLTKTEDRQWTKIISDSDNAVKTKEANQKEVSGLFAKLNENNPQVLKNNPALVVKLANAKNGVEFNQLLATNGIGLGKPIDGAQAISPYRAELATTGRQAVSGLLGIAMRNTGIFGRTAAAPIPDFARSADFLDYQAKLDFLKGNIIPAALTAMREASKTGGALGQVSDREGAWLGASLGSLSMSQSPTEVVNQLRQIDQHLANWQNAVDKYGDVSTGTPITAPTGEQIIITD